MRQERVADEYFWILSISMQVVVIYASVQSISFFYKGDPR